MRTVACWTSAHIGQVNGDNTSISADAGEVGHLIFGPYETRAAGRHEVAFAIKLISYPAERLGDFICAVVDVVANDGSVVLARRQIRRAQLEAGNALFTLEFELAAPRVVEYRLATTGQAKISVAREVRVASRPTPSRSLVIKPNAQERAWDNEAAFLDGYLRNVTGVIHIGANTGQERLLYEIIGLDVLWIEAIEEVYQQLLDNIAPYRRQRALCALLTDKAGETYDFNVSNFGAGSSSILSFAQHAEVMPDIRYVENRKIISTTFDFLIAENEIDLRAFQALTLDVEGSEHLVLKAMEHMLSGFRYVECEVSDYPSRVGSPTTDDLDAFRQLVKRAFGYGVNGNGTFWDIVWKKAEPDAPLFRPGVELPFIANDEPAWEHRMAERLSPHAILPS